MTFAFQLALLLLKGGGKYQAKEHYPGQIYAMKQGR